MNIFVPPIVDGERTIRNGKTYDTTEWIGAEVDTVLDSRKPRNGFEGEGFVIDQAWEVMIFNGSGFQSAENVEDIRPICENPTSEETLNREIRGSSGNGVFGREIARISQELYLPCIEFSFNTGFGTDDLFRNILRAYGELDHYLSEKGLAYLPSGNMPVVTKNLPNLANEYYRYLFEIRDGYDIAYFRWAGFQLHKEMDNYSLAVYTYNKIRHVLPAFLVLSENSPFADGTYQWNLSERTSTKSDWKMTGIPESISTQFLSDLQRWLHATIKSVTPYYFAVRYPRVDIRTIENCSMDTVSDVPLMCALIDLYYRITEKLKLCYVGNAPLPRNLFGDNDHSAIETSVIRENYHRGIRFGTDATYSMLGDGNYSFREYLENLYEFVRDVPSVFPDFVKRAFWYGNTDATHEVISEVLSRGNLAERTLQDFGISKKMPANPIEIDNRELRQYLVGMAQNFRSQVLTALDHSNEKDLNPCRL